MTTVETTSHPRIRFHGRSQANVIEECDRYAAHESRTGAQEWLRLKRHTLGFALIRARRSAVHQKCGSCSGSRRHKRRACYFLRF